MELPKNVISLFPPDTNIIKLVPAAGRRVSTRPWQPESGIPLFIPRRPIDIRDDEARQLLHMFRKLRPSLEEIKLLKRRLGLDDPGPSNGGLSLGRGRQRLMQEKTTRVKQAA